MRASGVGRGAVRLSGASTARSVANSERTRGVKLDTRRAREGPSLPTWRLSSAVRLSSLSRAPKSASGRGDGDCHFESTTPPPRPFAHTRYTHNPGDERYRRSIFFRSSFLPNEKVHRVDVGTPGRHPAALPEAERTCRSRDQVLRELRGGAARELRESRVGRLVETHRASSEGRHRFLFGVRGGLRNPRFRRCARRPTRRRREPSDPSGRNVVRAEAPGARQRRSGELVWSRGWWSEPRLAAAGRGREARTQVRSPPSEFNPPWPGRSPPMRHPWREARRCAPLVGPSHTPNAHTGRRPIREPARDSPPASARASRARSPC